jgi:hypothetical protein
MFDFSEPVGFTIFCDDIRGEVEGKTSLIGIYDAAMFIHVAFPARLPKFGFHIQIYEPANLESERDFPVEINIYLPGDEEGRPSLSAELPANPEAARSELAKKLGEHPTGKRSLLARITFNWIVSPLVLKEPGVIRVFANYKGDSLRCGSLRVIPAETLTPAPNPVPS